MTGRLSVLCYGDSNTWGYVPGGGGRRFDLQQRWPGVLQAEMGDVAHISENGVNGRTVASDEPQRAWRNGMSALMATLQAHKPLDWVVVMLGTNDLKPQYSLGVPEILFHMQKLVQRIQQSGCGRSLDASDGQPSPRILLVAPPLLQPKGLIHNSAYDAESESRMRLFRTLLAQSSAHWGCDFLLLPELCGSERDGIHLSADDYDRLGKAVAAWILRSTKNLFSQFEGEAS